MSSILMDSVNPVPVMHWFNDSVYVLVQVRIPFLLIVSDESF